MESSPSRPRVLVIRGGAIGDFILTLPALRLLRETLPACEVEVLGYPGIIELAVKAGLAETTRSLEHRSMALLFAKGATIDPALIEYLCGFKMVISYLYDPDGILKANLERIGVKTLIECPHSVLPGKGHASLQLARSLEKLAMWIEDSDWRRPLFPSWREGEGLRRVAIHLGSGSETKNWPVEHWRALAVQLQQDQPEVQILFITGEAEVARGVDLTALRREFELWHALPLPELADRLGTCELFLGHDSGISHLASACGVPCLLLFGPTDPDLWAPPQPTVRVVRAEGGDLKTLSLATVKSALAESFPKA